jgi:hypothetical protein
MAPSIFTLTAFFGLAFAGDIPAHPAEAPGKLISAILKLGKPLASAC